MSVDIDRDGTNGAVLHLVVEAICGHQLLELTSALGNFEPAVLDLLETMVAREIVCAMTRKEDMRPFIKQSPCKADGRARSAQSRHGPGCA